MSEGSVCRDARAVVRGQAADRKRTAARLISVAPSDHRLDPSVTPHHRRFANGRRSSPRRPCCRHLCTPHAADTGTEDGSATRRRRPRPFARSLGPGLAVLDPAVDRRRPVHRIGTRSPTAVQHTRHQEHAQVVAHVQRRAPDLLVILDAAERRERGSDHPCHTISLPPFALNASRSGLRRVHEGRSEPASLRAFETS